VRLVITSQKMDTLDRWQRVFEGCPDVICQRGLRAETPVDAVHMAGVFALNATVDARRRGGSDPGEPAGRRLAQPHRRASRQAHGQDAQGGWKVQAGHAHLQPAYLCTADPARRHRCRVCARPGREIIPVAPRRERYVRTACEGGGEYWYQ
jgi:hypothetical protein